MPSGRNTNSKGHHCNIVRSTAPIKFNQFNQNYLVIFEVKSPVECLSKKATSLRMTDWKKLVLKKNRRLKNHLVKVFEKMANKNKGSHTMYRV